MPVEVMGKLFLRLSEGKNCKILLSILLLMIGSSE